MLKPGATIGILGGGQLARMLALAAAPLGLRCHVYSPEKDSCAFDVVHAGTSVGLMVPVSKGAQLKAFYNMITQNFQMPAVPDASPIVKRLR